MFKTKATIFTKMELSKNFTHNEAEAKWYQHWLDKGYFYSTPDEREAYTIVMPPPNVTGVLHMGHALNNTIQDILIRRARMQGKNACWIPGTDHASIATEAKVVAMLRERGITKSSLTRDEFLGYAWEWKEKYGGIILHQLKKLGYSLDWKRTSFTMDEDYYNSVIKIFVALHEKGVIYRGKRMINWDVRAKTALSDEEVIHKEVASKLYHVKYFIEENGKPSDKFITVATVRPETITGDTAICVNPNDERYTQLHGRFAYVPLINRRIPIIADDYVTMDFGTGALKVTPAHDVNDYQLGQKYNLEIIDTMNDDGTMSEAAQIFPGIDRMEVRKKIIPLLEAAGNLSKIEDYISQVGFSERTDAIVEPRLSLQWWVSMKALSTPALKAVMDEEIKFYPPKFKNTYRHWMDNIKDWCISRQLWWGHRIPAWYDNEGRFVVAEDETKAKEIFNKKYSIANAELKQDEDCLDTWFSSWLWPFEVFKGYSNPGNADIKYYYPTNTLVTAPEIIFFWVARMIMAGFEYMDEKPFKEVYFTGIVRDKQGRKMSKSLGNSPDLLGLIEQYGADAVRFGIMISSPAGNDLLFDESALEQGRNFNNKLWNALKLLKMWEGKQSTTDNRQQTTDNSNFAIEWFDNRLNEVKNEVENLMKQFRLSEALKTVYSLIWDDFCSWYLEWVKPGFEQSIEATVYNKTVDFFDELMQLLHPFTPFISEEIYHLLKEQKVDLCVRQLEQHKAPNTEILQQGELLKQVISALRDARNKNQIKPKDIIQLHIQASDKASYASIENILSKQINAANIYYISDSVANTIVVAVEKDKFFIESERQLDSATLKNDLLKDLEHQKGFLLSVQKKLSNEKFVQNAKPEVLAMEQKKMADAEARIKTIQESLVGLN
ncbi:MAG TPA: valine--tRNA ligase [Ferruginibacter sp.]|nr:valine--tRNA ligase [Ferruginibacter sp.]